MALVSEQLLAFTMKRIDKMQLSSSLAGGKLCELGDGVIDPL
jgi:hypothetical protein